MPNLDLRPLNWHTLALALFCLYATVASAQPAEEDEYIQIKYRTFGWGLQKTLSTLTSKGAVNVYDTQFSEQQRYTGPRVIRFYSNKYGGIDEWEASTSVTDSASDVDNQDSAEALNPPPPLAEVTIPHGIKEVLFIFIPAPRGTKLPLSVVALDDSLARTDDRNVHFYNLSPIELVVKTFDKVKKIAPRQQSRWELKADENESSIAIAVTDPETKVVYSTRYRMRDGQRIVFFARKQEDNNSDGTPKLHVTTLINRIESKQASLTDSETDE
jgi:hypothetical protein